MASFKVFLLLSVLFAALLLISSHVSASEDLTKENVETKGVDDAKYGGYQGGGGGYPGRGGGGYPGGGGGGYPGRGGGGYPGGGGGGYPGRGGGGYPGGGGGGYPGRGGGGYPGRGGGGGYPGGCRYGCCHRNPYGSGCRSCCSYAGEAVVEEAEAVPHN